MPEPRKGSQSASSNKKRKSEIRDTTLASEKEISKTDLKIFLDFATDILDKQYRSYVWNDGKVQSLVTIDTALIAGVLVILQIFQRANIVALFFLACAFLSLIASFIVCLSHSIPRLNSGIGNEVNLRSMIGIVRLDKDEYLSKLMGLDLANMIKMTSWQISGMSRNNLRSHNLIQRGVILTSIGVLAIAVAVPIIAVTNWTSINVLTTQITSLPPTPSITNSLTLSSTTQQSPTPSVSPFTPTEATLMPSLITSTASISSSATP